jgi:hypothetical protein
MIIDLNEWTECTKTGPLEALVETPLEYMSIVTADVIVEIPEEVNMPQWKVVKGTGVSRTFWRVKK